MVLKTEPRAESGVTHQSGCQMCESAQHITASFDELTPAPRHHCCTYTTPAVGLTWHQAATTCCTSFVPSQVTILSATLATAVCLFTFSSPYHPTTHLLSLYLPLLRFLLCSSVRPFHPHSTSWETGGECAFTLVNIHANCATCADQSQKCAL